MRQSKKMIRAWIPVLDECIENWKMTVKDGEQRVCPACTMMGESRWGKLAWKCANASWCPCPLSASDSGCCDGRYDKWDETRSGADARRVLAYIRKVRKQLEEALK